MITRDSFIISGYQKNFLPSRIPLFGSLANHLRTRGILLIDNDIFGYSSALNFYFCHGDFYPEFHGMAVGYDPFFYKNFAYSAGLRAEEHSSQKYSDLYESIRYNMNLQWTLYLLSVDLEFIKAHYPSMILPKNTKNINGFLINVIGYDNEGLIIGSSFGAGEKHIPNRDWLELENRNNNCAIPLYPDTHRCFHWFYIDPPVAPNTETYPKIIMFKQAITKIIYKMNVPCSGLWCNGIQGMQKFFDYIVPFLTTRQIDEYGSNFLVNTIEINKIIDPNRSFCRSLFCSFLCKIQDGFLPGKIDHILSLYLELTGMWQKLTSILEDTVSNTNNISANTVYKLANEIILSEIKAIKYLEHLKETLSVENNYNAEN